MTKNAVLLTDWDPHCYSPAAYPVCIVDLALSALLHQDVFIRAIDLLVNQSIATRLWTNKSDLSLFEELLDADCLKLISTDPANYKDPRLQDLAVKSPITARAKDQLERSFAGVPWEPEEWVWDLCRHLDGIVKGHIRPAVKPPDKNEFAATLARILMERNEMKLAATDQFGDIDDAVATRFIEFCTKPGSWRAVLTDVTHASKREEFFRTEAYQCAHVLFPENVGIINLVQAVYMGLESQREGAAGRFGRKLWEPPFRFLSVEEEAEARERALHIHPVTVRKKIPIMLRTGLGKTLARTRKSDEFRTFQQGFGVIAEADLSRDPFSVSFAGVASRFAEEAAKLMVPYGTVERYTAIGTHLVCAVGWAAARTMGFSLGIHTGLDLDPVVEPVVSKCLARVTSEMAHVIRSALFANSLSASVVHAVDLRSIPTEAVPPSTTTPEAHSIGK
jgi:hypothetical protein